MQEAKANWVAMGYIKGAFGIKGWVKAAVSTESADALFDYPVWRLRQGQDIRNLKLEEGHIAGDVLHVKLANINDRDAAQALRGYTIEIQRSDFAPTEEDEYYWADLIGLTVVNRLDENLGKVSKLMETGAHDVLVVDGDYGQKLIPFVSQYIDQVEVESGQIRVDWGSDY